MTPTGKVFIVTPTDEVEYVEFCLQTEVVSDYARITLHNGLAVTFQHIDINGGGYISGIAPEKKPSTTSPKIPIITDSN
jgi:hypothetical protein